MMGEGGGTFDDFTRQDIEAVVGNGDLADGRELER